MSSSTPIKRTIGIQEIPIRPRKTNFPTTKKPNLMRQIQKQYTVRGFQRWESETAYRQNPQPSTSHSAPSTSASASASISTFRQPTSRPSTSISSSLPPSKYKLKSRKLKTYSAAERAQIRKVKPIEVVAKNSEPEVETISSDSDEDPDYVYPEEELSSSPSPPASPSSPNLEEEQCLDDEENEGILIVEPTFPYIPTKSEIDRGSAYYFCPFCDKTYGDFNLALHHIRVHLKFGYHCKIDDHFELSPSFMAHHMRKEHKDEPIDFIDDHVSRRSVNSWIIDFLNEQFNWFKLADNVVTEKPNSWVQCPICLKVAKFKKLQPFKFDSFRALDKHYWQHSRWWRVDCVICGASVQRAHQHDHLAGHDIIMSGTNFTIYFQERIDEITSHKLEDILEIKEKEFYSRLAYYRGARLSLNIKLKPCDSDLDYASKNKKAKPVEAFKETESEPSTSKGKSAKKYKRIVQNPSSRSSTDSHYDDLSADLESEAAIRLAMKILSGGDDCEFDDSSTENEPPPEPDRGSCEQQQSAMSSRSVTHEKEGASSNTQITKDLRNTQLSGDSPHIAGNSEEDIDSSRKDQSQHLAEISSNAPNSSPKTTVRSSENLVNPPPTALESNNSLADLANSSLTSPSISNNPPNQQVLLSPESSFSQILAELHQETIITDGHYKIPTLIDSNVDSLIDGDPSLTELLSDTPNQPSINTVPSIEQTTAPNSSSIPSSLILPPSTSTSPPSTSTTSTLNSSSLLKRPPFSVPRSQGKFCKERVLSVIQEVLTQKHEGSKNKNIAGDSLHVKESDQTSILANPNTILPRSVPPTTSKIPNQSRPIFGMSFPPVSSSPLQFLQSNPCLNAESSELTYQNGSNNNNNSHDSSQVPQFCQQQASLQQSCNDNSYQQPQQNLDNVDDDDICILEARITNKPKQLVKPIMQLQQQLPPVQRIIEKFAIDFDLFKQVVGPIDDTMIEKSENGILRLKIPIEKLQQMSKLAAEKKHQNDTSISSSSSTPVTISPSTLDNGSIDFNMSCLPQSIPASISNPVTIPQRPLVATTPMGQRNDYPLVNNALRSSLVQKPQTNTNSSCNNSLQQLPCIQYPQSPSVTNFRPNYLTPAPVYRVQQVSQQAPYIVRSYTTSGQRPVNTTGIARIIRFQNSQSGSQSCIILRPASQPIGHQLREPVQVQNPLTKETNPVYNHHHDPNQNIQRSLSRSSAVGSPALHYHPSPPPPYSQTDSIHTYSRVQQPPQIVYSQSQSYQQQHQHQHQQPLQPPQQPQQMQQQLQQHLQLQQQHQQQQPQQMQLQQQQQLQQPTLQQILQQNPSQIQQQYQAIPSQNVHQYQQNIYQQSMSVSEQVSSLADHSYTTELQYQQITQSLIPSSSQLQNNNLSDGLVENYNSTSTVNNQIQSSYDLNNLNSLDTTQNCASNYNQPMQQSPLINNNQPLMETNLNNNHSDHQNWPIVNSSLSKSPIDDPEDIQVVANFETSGPKQTFWKPDPTKIFGRDPYHSC